MGAQTILVVEDNPITRKMMRFALESEGYVVLEAGDGKTALRAGGEPGPDLVLQDYVLPDMDGLRSVQGLRALPGGSTLPILVVTGMVSQLDVLRDQAGPPRPSCPSPSNPRAWSRSSAPIWQAHRRRSAEGVACSS